MNVVIKMIHRPSCDVIVTSFSMVIRSKTVTQGCNASIKPRKFVLLIGFWVGNKEQYVLVVCWQKLRFKRWLLISKSQHILYVSSELLHEILLTSSWRHPLITWSPFYPYFISSLRLLGSHMSLWLVKRLSVNIISPLRQPWSQGLVKNHSIHTLPLPTLMQCWQNTSLHFTIFQH